MFSERTQARRSRSPGRVERIRRLRGRLGHVHDRFRVHDRFPGRLRARGTVGRCASCGGPVLATGACRRCGWKQRLSAPEWIALLVDRDSFDPLGPRVSADPLRLPPPGQYAAEVAEARAATGVDEAVVAGVARIAGHEVVVATFDFRFFGGSLGVAAGERLVQAFEAAAARHCPAILVVSSSGARMQEGLAALFQMARSASAVARLHAAGAPLVAVLADPTTGAPYASCASLADFVIAERGALVAFAGPRIVSALTDADAEPMRSEHLFEVGGVDALAERHELRGRIAALVHLLANRDAGAEYPTPPVLPMPAHTVNRWELVREARDPSRPSGRRWLETLAGSRFELVGDRCGSDDRALVTALADVGGVPSLVIAQDGSLGPVAPAGYRKAVRALAIAARLRLPVLSLVDTPGAAVGRHADEQGIAYWVAQCFSALLGLPAPVVSLVVGQGSSGGALALAVADRTYILESAFFTVLSPEGAAVTIDRDASTAPEWADRLRLTAADAYGLGLVDGVVPVRGESRRARAARVRSVRKLVAAAVSELLQFTGDELVDARRRRYLDMTRPFLRPLGTT